jgi:hypothetical protein
MYREGVTDLHDALERDGVLRVWIGAFPGRASRKKRRQDKNVRNFHKNLLPPKKIRLRRISPPAAQSRGMWGDAWPEIAKTGDPVPAFSSAATIRRMDWMSPNWLEFPGMIGYYSRFVKIAGRRTCGEWCLV